LKRQKSCLKDERVPESSLAEINLIAGKAAMKLNSDDKAIEFMRQSIRRSPQGSFGAEAVLPGIIAV
jgi:hypothetical protein